MSQHLRKQYKCIKAITTILFVLLFLTPQAVYADVDNPLVDALRCPALQAAYAVGGGGVMNVDYDEVTLYLSFSHNVADASLRENNIKAISVMTEDGENIPVEIGFSDAFADRCNIYVTMHNLYPATKYYICVAASLKAYNGSYANVDSKTFFTTKAEVVHDGSEEGYDQGETDSGYDSGGESQGEETSDRTKEETGNPGEEITEDNMVIITDNGSETTDPEEEENEEEDEEEDHEEEDEPEMMKKSGDGKTGAVIQNPGENLAGGNSSDISGDRDGSAEAFGNEEEAGVQEATASEQETSQEAETQKAETEPESEQEKAQESQPEPERQWTARDSRLSEGQQTARDSRLPERILAGLLAAALLLAAVADRMRKRKATGYERKEA